jgi:TRAP-type C4-dicarboxylate transport system substrate-binding protein
VPEVLSSLQTGLLNAFMTTPIFATGAQWFTQSKYWTDSNHVYQPAAVVFDTKFWAKLPDDLKQQILAMRPELQASARKNVRGLDEELFRGFKEKKIEINKLSAAERAELKKKTTGVADALIAKGAFPREWYDRVQKALKDYRAGKK